MKLLNSSAFIPFAGTAVIALFSLLLYLDLTKSTGAGRTEQVGTITFKRQVAQRKYSAQVVWENIRQDAPVYNYDTIRTADISEAEIRLKDGTLIALNENSMILLAVSKDDVRVEFGRGSMKASRGDGQEGLKKLNISAGDTTVLVDKGDVNLAQGLNKSLSLTLNRGGAIVKAGAAEKLLSADEKIMVAGDDMRVFKLGIKLLTPLDGENIITAAGRASVAFSWEPVKEGYDVYFETAPEHTFAYSLEKKKTAGPAANAHLRHGVYYWRVTAVHRKSGKIESSEVRRIVVLENGPLELITPRDGTVFRYSTRPPIVNFKWSGNESDSDHMLTVARDAGMNEIIKNIELKSTSIAVDDLEAGTWFWRVSRQVTSTAESAPVSSRVNRLVIEKTDSILPPEPQYPADSASLNRLVLEKDGLAFTWKKNSDLQSFRLTVAGDREFRRIVQTTDSTSNFAQLETAPAVGAYYWKVSGLSDGKEATAPSGIREFRVVESDTIELLRPADNAVLAPAGDERFAPVRFAWKSAGLSGRYRLQVSTDASFSALSHDAAADDNGYTVSRIEAGEYYWRVLLQDKDGSALMKGGPFRLTVKESLALPAAISPAGGSVVNMSDKDALSFRWREVRGANLYRVGVYQRRGGAHINILEKEVQTTELVLGELEKLDVGRFYWTVQALEVRGIRKTLIRKSPEMRSEFTITLGGTMTTPKITSPKTLYIE